MARLRAVVMIQPAGLGGAPSPGQRCEGGRERVGDRVLGQVDVAQHADENRDGPAVLGAEDRGDLLRCHRRQKGGTSLNGRTSIGSVVAAAALRPQLSAASRSGAVIT